MTLIATTCLCYQIKQASYTILVERKHQSNKPTLLNYIYLSNTKQASTRNKLLNQSITLVTTQAQDEQIKTQVQWGANQRRQVDTMISSRGSVACQQPMSPLWRVKDRHSSKKSSKPSSQLNLNVGAHLWANSITRYTRCHESTRVALHDLP